MKTREFFAVVTKQTRWNGDCDRSLTVDGEARKMSFCLDDGRKFAEDFRRLQQTPSPAYLLKRCAVLSALGWALAAAGTLGLVLFLALLPGSLARAEGRTALYGVGIGAAALLLVGGTLIVALSRRLHSSLPRIRRNFERRSQDMRDRYGNYWEAGLGALRHLADCPVNRPQDAVLYYGDLPFGITADSHSDCMDGFSRDLVRAVHPGNGRALKGVLGWEYDLAAGRATLYDLTPYRLFLTDPQGNFLFGEHRLEVNPPAAVRVLSFAATDVERFVPGSGRELVLSLTDGWRLVLREGETAETLSQLFRASADAQPKAC